MYLRVDINIEETPLGLETLLQDVYIYTFSYIKCSF